MLTEQRIKVLQGAAQTCRRRSDDGETIAGTGEILDTLAIICDALAAMMELRLAASRRED